MYHVESEKKAQNVRNYIRIMYFGMMVQYWETERSKYWPQEQQNPCPIQVRLEKANRRIDAVKREFWQRRYQLSHRGPLTDFINPPLLAPARRPADWHGTTQIRAPVTEKMYPFQYVPYCIRYEALQQFFPEEAKWWLDGLRARHLEFEEDAVYRILNRKRGDSFKHVVNKCREEWDNHVKRWLATPKSVFKPLFWYNSPAMMKKR